MADVSIQPSGTYPDMLNGDIMSQNSLWKPVSEGFRGNARGIQESA